MVAKGLKEELQLTCQLAYNLLTRCLQLIQPCGLQYTADQSVVQFVRGEILLVVVSSNGPMPVVVI